MPAIHIRALLPLGLVTGLLAFAGCQIGPRSLEVASAHYSDAVRVAQSEQLLVNLARLRYRDAPVFLAVGSISTQFELTGSGNVGASAVDGGSDVLDAGIGVAYSERPTISFSLWGGESFQKRMLRPIDTSVIALLTESGWRGDRILRIAVEKLNGLPNAQTASGPTPGRAPNYEDFLEAVTLLQDLVNGRAIDFEYETRRETISDPIPVAQIEGADLVSAAASGVEFEISEDGERIGLIVEKRRLVLRFTERSDGSAEAARLRELLRLDPTRRRFDIIALEDSEFDPFDDGQLLTELAIDTRSLMGVLYYLSHGVEVPAEDLEAGRVTATEGDAGPFAWSEMLGDLFHVRTSEGRPADAAMAVRHRGRWFSIDDADEDSKSTFLLLMQLFSLQAGDVEDVKPVLTLPVG